MRRTIEQYAQKHGMSVLHDPSRTNISVQIIDLAKVDTEKLPAELTKADCSDKVLIVMDYAFGEAL